MHSATLWFPVEGCPETEGHVFLWQQYLPQFGAEPKVHSLPQLVHDETDRWKQTYLEWLEDIGQAPVGAKTLEQQLQIRPDLSYWWMTIPTEWSFSEDAIAYNAIRAWAFAEQVKQLGLTKVNLVGASPEVAAALHSWAKRNGIEIRSAMNPKGPKPNHSWKRALWKSSNVCIQALFAIRHLGKHYSEYGLGNRSSQTRTAPKYDELTIIDDLAHLQVDDSKPPKYSSHYWGDLPSELARQGKSVHWLHWDYRSARVSSLREARSVVASMGCNFPNQRHSLIQDGMSPRDMTNAVKSLVSIYRLGLRARGGRIGWQQGPYGIDMWPLVKRTWRRSFYGTEAAQNALSLQFFDFSRPLQRPLGSCIYLMENQPWELVLLSGWRAISQRHISGVAHGVVRKWDTRYGLGHSVSREIAQVLLPRPDAVLVNGPASLLRLEEYGFATNTLFSVEALRYLPAHQDSNSQPIDSISSGKFRVLALGEFTPITAATQIFLLNDLVKLRGSLVDVTYRPHPGVLHDLGGLDPQIKLSSPKAIGDDLRASDVVFCNNVSTASLDALLAGVPTIVYRDGGVLDGQLVPAGSGSFSVATSRELIAAIDAHLSTRFPTAIRGEEVFNLDAGLTGWRKFIGGFC